MKLKPSTGVGRELRKQHRVMIHIHFFLSLLSKATVHIVWFWLIDLDVLTNTDKESAVLGNNPVSNRNKESAVPGNNPVSNSDKESAVLGNSPVSNRDKESAVPGNNLVSSRDKDSSVLGNNPVRSDTEGLVSARPGKYKHKDCSSQQTYLSFESDKHGIYHCIMLFCVQFEQSA